MNRFFLSFYLILLSAAAIFPQSKSKEFDTFLSDYFYSKKLPSVSAGVFYIDKIVWTNALGLADVENNVAAIPQTVYRIASISKSITAVTIMQLVEQGKINLDDDARKYVPYFPKKRWTFTIRQILSHTSGLRNYKIGEFDSKDYYDSIEKSLGVILNDSLEFQPGTRYLYTTLGFNFLAAVIENVTGLSYNEYIRRNIFIPAEMNSTYPEIQKNIINNRARGYDKNNFRDFENAPLADLSIKYPGGGFISTSEDLLKFASNLLNGKLIKSSTLDTMLVPLRLKNGETRNYGLGFIVDTDSKGRKYFGHSGGGTGFSSMLIIYREQKIASANLINVRDRDLDQPALDLANIALGDQPEKPKKSLADRLLSTTLDYNIDSAMVEYQLIKKDSLNKYIVTPNQLNLFGRDLITVFKINDAIILYKMLLQEYPNNADAMIGLAEAYQKDGNRGLALRYFKNAIKLQPENKYVSDMIKKLEPQAN